MHNTAPDGDTTPSSTTSNAGIVRVSLEPSGDASQLPNGSLSQYTIVRLGVYGVFNGVKVDDATEHAYVARSFILPLLPAIAFERFLLTVRVRAGGTDKRIVAKLTYNDDPTFTQTMEVDKTLTNSFAGYRWGFQLDRPGTATTYNQHGHTLLDAASFSYTATAATPAGVRGRVISVGGTTVYEENNSTQLEAVTITNGTAPTANRLLQAAELRGKLYIVNYAADTNDATTEPSFLVYDPSSADTLFSMLDYNLALGGTYAAVLPDGLSTSAVKCELVATYRDALLFAGKRGAGNEWYLTKRGASPETVVAASAPEGSATAFVADTSVTSFVVGSTSEAGRVGEPITALMRHSDDYMLFGCQSSVWVLRGDPNIGGTLDVLDPRHGVISASAHCRGPGSSSFFLALDGLYVIPYGGQQEPIPLSKKLPQELRYINVVQNRVFLAYDVIHEGIIIAVTRIDGGQGSYFFYDMDTQGFFPMKFPSHCEPTFLHYYSADLPSQRAVLFGGRDGYIRQFDDFGQSQNDDGIEWTSRMKIGPVLLAPSGYSDGMVREVIPQTAVGSGDVNMFIQVGDNAETAIEAVERAGFTARAGLQLTWTPTLRGNACYIGFEKTGGKSWAMEKMTVVREPLGKLRP